MHINGSILYIDSQQESTLAALMERNSGYKHALATTLGVDVTSVSGTVMLTGVHMDYIYNGTAYDMVEELAQRSQVNVEVIHRV